ncbi:MAG: hypothetical protein JJW00_09760 [Sulfurimonas sp.]|nr:hypothetical protein [Sulfurimonas sp.]
MKKELFVLVLILLFLQGCAQKVTISALKPAKIDEIANYKKIAIVDFKNDTVGFSSKLETNLVKVKVRNKPFFTVISRRNIDNIMEEQRLQLSGLVKRSDIVEVGKLLGANAIISGSVSDASASAMSYTEKRSKCYDKKCKKFYEYNVGCTRQTISLAVEIKIISVENANIIYADTLKDKIQKRYCSDRGSSLLGKGEGLNLLADRLAKSFTSKISPYYASYKVELFDDPDIDYTDEQEKLLEDALKYIENRRYAKAEELLSRLLDSTDNRCYVAAYDLAILKESNAELEKAQKLYMLADSLIKEPNSSLDRAINRIDNSIYSKKQALKQLNK